MNPKVWGKCMWESMHNIAASYPINPTPKDKKKYCQFFKALSDVLPCRKCRKSLKVHMKCIPISKYMKNRSKLLYWTYLIHNRVNRELEKNVYVSWKYVKQKYIKTKE